MLLKTNVYAPELYPRKKSRLVKRHEAQMAGTLGVDPAIIADQLGLQVRTVCSIQRKLGLRQCVPVNPPRRGR
jgi:hypothetical protein